MTSITSMIGSAFGKILNTADKILYYVTPKPQLSDAPLSIEVGRPTEDCTAPRAHPPLSEEQRAILTHIEGKRTIAELFEAAVLKYGDRPCMGTRIIERIEKEKKVVHGREKIWETVVYGPTKWETFSEVGQHVKDVGSGIIQFTGLKAGESIAIYEDTKAEWMITFQAALRQGLSVITVYATLGENALLHSLKETEVTAIFVNAKNLKKMINYKKDLPHLKYIIYYGEASAKDLSNDKGKVQIKSYDEIKNMGRGKEITPEKSPNEDDVALIMYTSGTTGLPKGVMLTHRNLIEGIKSALTLMSKIKDDDIFFAYLPLAHNLEMVAENICLVCGVRLAYANPRTLAEAIPHGDFKEFRPTLFVAVPRVFETIKKKAKEVLSSQSQLKQWLFNQAYSKRLSELYAGRDTPLYDWLVFSKFRQILGGRVRFLLSGGAPISRETQEFMRVCIGCPFIQGYGLTETCSAGTFQHVDQKFTTLNVGGPTSVVQIKLKSCPELGYNAEDNKGEILIKGKNLCKGYFNREEESKKAFSEDGWFFTGDIGQWLEDGSLQIIDRKKNLVKLAHGEYVALENLESLYATSPFISPNGICLYADSYSDFIVALAIPQTSYVTKWAKENHIGADNMQELYENEKLKKVVLEDLIRIAKENDKQKFEIPRNIRLYDDDWTIENGLLTAAMKIKRNRIYKKYEKDIKEMYSPQDLNN